MKIQFTPKRILEDAMVIWPEAMPDVDLIQDPRPPYGLKFRPESISVIYAFNVLGMTPSKDVPKMVRQWFELLEPGGQLYIIEPDFEYLSRAVVGGDIKIKEFNESFIKKSYYAQDDIVGILDGAGFPLDGQRAWLEGLKFGAQHYEKIISGSKPAVKKF